MKHHLPITLLLLLFFFIAQLLGLGLLTLSSDVIVADAGEENQTIIVAYEDTAIGERPAVQDQSAVIYLAVGILLGTLLILWLRKLRRGMKIWKFWYGLAVFLTLSVSFGVIVHPTLAFFIALAFTFLKLKRPTVITHNVSELFMYAGLGLLLAPLFSIFWAIVMLLVISLYDAYAVWHSKHMIKLAEFATESKLFAGFFVPYEVRKKKVTIHTRRTATKAKTTAKKKTTGRFQAILGGGDVVFPLLFSGAVLTALLQANYTKLVAFLLVSLQTLVITFALYLLFRYGKKDRFYPAMPFITAGCLAGFGVLELVLLFM